MWGLALCNPIVPLERRRKLVHRVLDVNDSAMGRSDRRGGSMQYQRAECENGALLHETILFRLPLAKLVDPSRREAATLMRAVDDANRPVAWSTGIEMNAHREHVLEHCDRRLNVGDARLLRPGPEARHFDPLPRGNGEVLMPHDFPVRGWGLVEEDGPDREARVAQNGSRTRASGGRRCQGPDAFVREQVARSATPVDREGGDGFTKRNDFVISENRGRRRPATLLDTRGESRQIHSCSGSGARALTPELS